MRLQKSKGGGSHSAQVERSASQYRKTLMDAEIDWRAVNTALDIANRHLTRNQSSKRRQQKGGPG